MRPLGYLTAAPDALGLTVLPSQDLVVCLDILASADVRYPLGRVRTASAKDVLESLSSLIKDFGKTIIMVTHDPSGAAYASVRHYYLDKGILVDSIK